MMSRIVSSVCAVAVLVVCSHRVHAAENLSYVDLVKRLTDLERLATLPAEGETCAQWSSYDRASQWDAEKGEYVRWDANDDGPHYIRQEGDEFVFAEMEGPGCIWRIWSARPEKGHVRIYLDGAEEPAVDLPFIGYFNRENEPFTYPSLVHMTARGQNSYIPIPYQKSCKIVADKGWGRYYHFTYGTFPEGTKVPTFKRGLSDEEKKALADADKMLSDCSADPAPQRTIQMRDRNTVKVAAGETARVVFVRGPQAITGIRAKLDLPESPADRQVLRELALQIKWDGETEPSVFAPFGDFFGTAPGANKYRSLPLGLTDDGWWYSYWYMPFAKTAEVELINDGDEEREVQFEVYHAPLDKPIEELGRFHAKWHRDVLPPPEEERAKIDWTILSTEGRGRYCGVMLHVWNPRGGWWGEGDEKFHVDGEKFPSTIGTGSEDYFGYAWGSGELFQNAYHNQTISMGNKGHISVNRWHITDNVPFQKSFDAYIEKYFKNDRPTLFSCITYWYLDPEGKDPFKPAPIDQRVGYWVDPATFKVENAIEGETIKVLGVTGGKTQEQKLTQYPGQGWSRQSHLWWTGGKPGDKLDLAIPVKKAGEYKVTLQLTKAGDYGIVQLYLNGGKLGDPVNLYDPNVIPSGPITAGTHKLDEGESKLTLEITGADKRAYKAYMAGVDYIQLDPVE